MPAEIREEDVETLRLPKNWHSFVRSAVLNVVGIVRVTLLADREALTANGDVKEVRIHQGEPSTSIVFEIDSYDGRRLLRVIMASRAA